MTKKFFFPFYSRPYKCTCTFNCYYYRYNWFLSSRKEIGSRTSASYSGQMNISYKGISEVIRSQLWCKRIREKVVACVLKKNDFLSKKMLFSGHHIIHLSLFPSNTPSLSRWRLAVASMNSMIAMYSSTARMNCCRKMHLHAVTFKCAPFIQWINWVIRCECIVCRSQHGTIPTKF